MAQSPKLSWMPVHTILYFFLMMGAVHAAPQQREEWVRENLKPLFKIVASQTENTATPVAVVATLSPEQRGKMRYQSSCQVCHQNGAAGAPRVGDKKVWSARLQEGEDTLVRHAIQGYKAMPAKGMCPQCSDEEIRLAVLYLLTQVK